MAWPDELPSVYQGGVARAHRSRRKARAYVSPWEINRGRFSQTGRGLYRVFNAPEFRFYRSNTGPPAETDAPFATNASLPYEPSDTYADGTWYLSVSYFNGVIDSGFLPIGPNGETYLRLDLVSGGETGAPPNPPTTWHIEPATFPEQVHLVATYLQVGPLRATEWAWWRSILGMFIDPETNPPDSTLPMFPATGLSVLNVDAGPFGAVGTVEANVLLRTRRNDGTVASPIWVYSENITYQGVTINKNAPATPAGGELWTGRLPEGS